MEFVDECERFFSTVVVPAIAMIMPPTRAKMKQAATMVTNILNGSRFPLPMHLDDQGQ